jgi:hypothetical protein
MSDRHKIEPSKIAGPKQRAEVIAGMREMADWLETHPGVPLHVDYGIPRIELFSQWFENDKALTTSPGRLARAMGKVKKAAYDWSSYFELRHDFSGGVFYAFNFSRDQICTPQVVGHRDKVETVFADAERANQLKAELEGLEKVEAVVGKEPIIEYDCQPLLSR